MQITFHMELLVVKDTGTFPKSSRVVRGGDYGWQKERI